MPRPTVKIGPQGYNLFPKHLLNLHAQTSADFISTEKGNPTATQNSELEFSVHERTHAFPTNVPLQSSSTAPQVWFSEVLGFWL